MIAEVKWPTIFHTYYTVLFYILFLDFDVIAVIY